MLAGDPTLRKNRACRSSKRCCANNNLERGHGAKIALLPRSTATEIKPFPNTVTKVPKCAGRVDPARRSETFPWKPFHGRTAAGLSDRNEREHRRRRCGTRSFRA